MAITLERSQRSVNQVGKLRYLVSENLMEILFGESLVIEN